MSTNKIIDPFFYSLNQITNVKISTDPAVTFLNTSRPNKQIRTFEFNRIAKVYTDQTDEELTYFKSLSRDKLFFIFRRRGHPRKGCLISETIHN